MINPLLSIVIANYNYGRFLSEALESVINQCDSPKLLSGEAILPITERATCGIELLICDGGSQDESVEVIKKYSNYIAWWCSERDGGQSEAFNKGFARAKGEWITWLNADDLYLEGTFKAFVDLVARSPNAEWITGNKVHYDSVTNKICSVNWGPHIMPPLLSRNRASSASFGPSAFWKKKLYARLGGIDETMHYAMDTEYWARATMSGVRQTRLRWLCWAFRDHESSKTVGIQTDKIVAIRARETEYWRGKTGYTYRHDFSNPWYWLWVIWRLLDGSLVMRAILKRRYEGRSIAVLSVKKRGRG